MSETQAPYTTRTPADLLAVILNGDMPAAKEAADELAARIDAMQAAAKMAHMELHATQRNWDEECLYNCNDILKSIIEGRAQDVIEKERDELREMLAQEMDENEALRERLENVGRQAGDEAEWKRVTK